MLNSERDDNYMKKALIYMIIAVMLMSMPCGAATSAEPQLLISENNISEGYIKLEMQLDNSYYGSFALVRAIDVAKGEEISKLVWADETRIDNKGTLKMTIDVSSFDTADYKFAADVEGLSGPVFTEPSIKIYNSGEKTTLWAKIKTAEENDDTSEIVWVIENRSEYLSLDKAGYDALGAHQTQFLTNVVNCSYASLDDFVKKFNLNIKLAGFIGADEEQSKSLMESLFDDFSMENSAAVTAYKNSEVLSASAVSDITANAATLTTDNFKLIFNTAIILKELSQNLELWSGYEEVLKRYATEIGITFSDYVNVANQSQLINTMIGFNSEFTSLSLAKSKFEELVAAAPKDTTGTQDSDNSANNSSSSGGSSGGGGKVVKDEKTEVTQPQKTTFSDIAGVKWAHEAISYLTERGVINGKAEGVFAPNDNLTRAEAVKLIVTAFNIGTDNEENVFNDIDKKDWYHSYVLAAYHNGLVNGIDENTFSPNAPVSRQDLAVMLSRLIPEGSEREEAITFADNGEIADYAVKAVTAMVNKGIINGTDGNRFAPNEKATRAQAAKMLFEMIKTGV